jgi:type I restriction enzyme S subunit
MTATELPATWNWRRLGDKRIVLDIQPGFACGNKALPDGVPHLRMNNISKDGLVDMSLVRRIPPEKADKADRWLQGGDVIFNNTNSTELVGKSCVFGGYAEPCTYSNHLTRLRCNPAALKSEWLWLCLHHLWLSGFFAANCREFVGQSAFNMDKLKAVEIPVPPLPEQERLVTRIEELARRVQAARRLHLQAQEQTDAYLSAAVARVFGAESHKRWVRESVRWLCEPPQYGYTQSAIAEPVGPRFLRITDIQNGQVDWDKVPYCRCDDVDKYRLRTGDILFARTGATTGKSYLVTDPPEAVFASYLIRLRAGPAILPEFLYWFFQSSDYWAAVSVGIDDGNRPNMNGTKLANLEVPYPEDEAEQRKIVEHLDGVRRKAEKLRSLQREVDAELEALPPAILAKAFRGEL